MNWPRISSGTISGSIAFGTSGIQLLKYFTAPFARMPSTCVKTKVISASASVTESVDVAAKIASVGHLDPADLDRLVRERQRDEAEHVDDPDEEHQRGDVREPAADRLRREPLLGDLHLRDLVDRSRRAPAAWSGSSADLDAHQDDPEHARDDRAEDQVRDRLVDVHAEREVDPGLELPLVGGVELLLGAVARRLRARRTEARRRARPRSSGRRLTRVPRRRSRRSSETASSTLKASA